MKTNQKILLVFMLMMIMIAAFTSFSKATDGAGSLDNLIMGNNTTTNNTTNNATTNNTVNNQANSEKLPQTGVAENTTLIIFIGVCVISAVYAYIKIKDYKSIK